VDGVDIDFRTDGTLDEPSVPVGQHLVQGDPTGRIRPAEVQETVSAQVRGGLKAGRMAGSRARRTRRSAY
jgi:hypothetical protein